MSTEILFEYLSIKMNITFQAMDDTGILVNFSDLMLKYQHTPAIAGHLYSELGSDHLYKSHNYHVLQSSITLGSRVIIFGSLSSGKSTLLALQIAANHRGKVKYLDMGLVTNIATAKAEIMMLSCRDLVILDDLHRSPSLSTIQLLKDMETDVVCNVIGITRRHFIETPLVESILRDGMWLEVQTKPMDYMDEIQELISMHHLRNLHPSSEAIASFYELFQDDLTVVCTALDSWGEQDKEISFSLVNDTMMERLLDIDGRMKRNGKSGAGRAVILLCAFWQFEITTSFSSLTSKNQWNIPKESILELELCGEINEKQTSVGKNEVSVEYFPAYHSNAAKLIMCALDNGRLKDNLIVKILVDEKWFTGHNFSQLDHAIIFSASKNGSFDITAHHEHFVYEDLRDEYIDLVEALLTLYHATPVKQTEMLLNLSSAYRRLGSVEFPWAKHCLKRAHSIK
jgi:hypothetical protein